MSYYWAGDSSDGIPNLLFDDDAFANESKRQKPCGEKKRKAIMESLDTWLETSNWERNQTLVDFEKIPDWVQDKIIGRVSLLLGVLDENCSHTLQRKDWKT